MTPINCNKCGQPIEPGSKFCGSCGEVLAASVPVENASGPAIAPSADSQPASPLPAGAAPAVAASGRFARPARILGLLDDGRVFHGGFRLCLATVAVLLVLFEVYRLIAGAFGNDGYFRGLSASFDDAAFFAVRSILCSLLTFVVSLAGLATMGCIVWSRAGSMLRSEYQGITVIVTRVIKLVGEVLAVVPIVAGVNAFLSLLFLTVPHGTPFGHLPTTLFDPLVKPLLGVFGMFQQLMLGSGVDSFGHYLVGVLGGLVLCIVAAVGAFLILVSAYWMAEILGILHGFLIHRPLFSREARR